MKHRLSAIAAAGLLLSSCLAPPPFNETEWREAVRAQRPEALYGSSGFCVPDCI